MYLLFSILLMDKRTAAEKIEKKLRGGVDERMLYLLIHDTSAILYIYWQGYSKSEKYSR